MSPLAALVIEYRDVLKVMRRGLEMLESGEMRTRGSAGAAMVDTTAESIQMLKDRMADLDALATRLEALSRGQGSVP